MESNQKIRLGSMEKAKKSLDTEFKKLRDESQDSIQK
ncbi:unnamed protein product, partial [Rotaria magnacalcarata]